MRGKNLLQNAVFVLMAVAFIGCAHAMDHENNSNAKITDANIAAIVVGANQIDISAGKIALDRSGNNKVREFAQRMVTDHQSVLDSALCANISETLYPC
jgi:putative membrane protein